MSRTSRRYKPLQVNNGAVPGCNSVRMPRARVLVFCLLGVLTLAMVLGLYLSNDTSSNRNNRIPVVDLAKDRLSHKVSKSSPSQVRRLVSQHISSTLSSLSAGWTVELDSFLSPTPRGQVTFSNIIATLDPGAPRRLLLTCHYDSKVLPPDPRVPERVFLGASDSAVPCAMILELASALDAQLKALNQQASAVTLQLVFFDGEESFEEWTATDSLYGSRHLAERMAHTPHPLGSTHTNLLQAVDLFVLLDLLGGPDPLIVNHFDNTARWFDRLIAAEKRLHRQGLLTSHPSEQTYFRKDVYLGPVQDDHIPFLHKGVPVLHVIATPFPPFWHTLDDTEENMHRPTVENLTKVLAVFLAEYLGF
ncbi:unnamed protein product [Coregonus sp. 'balchen']|nr:unnamed protein product [Coregonus sp. 'balchen']